MGKVIDFPGSTYCINGHIVKKPVNRKEYLSLCKRFIPANEYEYILLAILDKEYYDEAVKEIKVIVDAYWCFKE